MIHAWILLISLGVFILLSVPIAFSIGLSSLLIIVFDERMSTWLLVQRTFAGLDSFVLLAVPLFLLTGLVMNASGVTDKLIRFSYVLVGHIRGGLALVNIVVSMFFAGISGSSTADTAGVGSILIPAMFKKGYSKEFTVAVTAASSTMGNIIPPSIMAVIYAATTGISVGALFLAGIVPGVLIGVSQMVMSYIYAIKYDYPSEERVGLKDGLLAVKDALLPLGTPVIIIGGITGGIFTATEAAVIAAVYSLILGLLVYRTVSFKRFFELLVETVQLSSISLFCIGIASVFGYIVAYYKVPVLIGNMLGGLSTSPTGLLITIVALFIIVGTFMDAAPAIIIMMPILYPIADKAGIHPVHLGVVVVSTLALGLITPPYGLCLLIASLIADISFEKTIKTVMVFFSVMLLIVMFSVFFPDVILFVPRVLAPKLMGPM